jgi:hypothetical protein
MSDSATQSAGELHLDDDVVSTATLAGLSAAVQSVSLRRGAVITPAARDLLRDKKIALAYRTATATAVAGKAELLLGVANTRFRADELVKALSRQPITVRQMSASGLFDLIAEIAKGLAGNQKLAILMTEDAAAAICLANRNAGVRAVAAHDGRTVASAVRSVGANMLIVDPSGRSLFQLKDIATRFAAGGPRTCPEMWRGRL